MLVVLVVLLILATIVCLPLFRLSCSSVVLSHLISHYLAPLYGVCNLGLEEACCCLEVSLLSNVVDEFVEVLLVERQVGITKLEYLLLELSPASESESCILVLLSKRGGTMSCRITSMHVGVRGCWSLLEMLVTK